MTWIFIALGGYFFNALAALFDKLLLSDDRIGSPALYAFFTSLVSLFALVLLPFGFVFVIPNAIFLGFVSGFLFLLGLIAFYEAVKRSEISRVAPLVGVSIIGFLFAATVVRGFFTGCECDAVSIIALLLLAVGSFFLAKPKKGAYDPNLVRFVLLSGALMAASLVVLKETYLLSNFATGFFWSRMGMFLTGMSLLVFPALRSQIFSGGDRHAKPTKRNAATATLFFMNKAFGGLGAFLISYAISLGPVTFVQGLNGAQFALVFLLAVPISIRYPKIFREETDRNTIIQKTAAIILIALGIALVATSGKLSGFL